jgi:hypothetical protein
LRVNKSIHEITRTKNKVTRNCCLSFLALSLISVAAAQDKHRRIGQIEFYGYAGLDLDKIRNALPFREGDELPDSDNAVQEAVVRIREAVSHLLGKPATDVEALCCNTDGDGIIYVGLPGSSIGNVQYKPPPTGSARLPASILSLYKETMEAQSRAVLRGASREDDSKGYALSIDPDVRAKQLATRAYALRHEHLVSRILATTRDPEQRIAAAYILGYARQSPRQIKDLVGASRDSDDTVRNNAIRALGVLARSNAMVAKRIPADHFIAMLSSGSWTDRNKGGSLLDELSKRRDPKLLSQLRLRSVNSLIEMARWRDRSHADTFRMLLGRVAGIEETRLQQLVQAEQVEQIIGALK